jgi:hypothetical protein
VPNPTENSTPVFRADTTLSARRPWPLTLLCVVGGVVLLWTVWHASGGSAARAFGRGYWLYFIATTGALGVALWGLWRLRRWALWAFPLALLLDDVVVGLMGELRLGVVAIQAALVIWVLSQVRAFGRRSARVGLPE